MVKDHPDSERGNPPPPHGLLFQLAAKVITEAGGCLGQIAPMTSTQIAPLSKHVTPIFVITITSAKIMMVQLIVSILKQLFK